MSSEVVDESQVDELIGGGIYTFFEEDVYKFQSPDGSIQDVAGADARRAVDSGMRFISDDALGGIQEDDEKLAKAQEENIAVSGEAEDDISSSEAFAYGIARGGTFRGSDIATRAAGKGEWLDRLDEQQGVAANLGEITGIVASYFSPSPKMLFNWGAAPVAGAANVVQAGASLTRIGRILLGTKKAARTVKNVMLAPLQAPKLVSHATTKTADKFALSVMNRFSSKFTSPLEKAAAKSLMLKSLSWGGQAAQEAVVYGIGHGLADKEMTENPDLAAEKFLSTVGISTMVGALMPIPIRAASKAAGIAGRGVAAIGPWAENQLFKNITGQRAATVRELRKKGLTVHEVIEALQKEGIGTVEPGIGVHSDEFSWFGAQTVAEVAVRLENFHRKTDDALKRLWKNLSAKARVLTRNIDELKESQRPGRNKSEQLDFGDYDSPTVNNLSSGIRRRTLWHRLMNAARGRTEGGNPIYANPKLVGGDGANTAKRGYEGVGRRFEEHARDVLDVPNQAPDITPDGKNMIWEKAGTRDVKIIPYGEAGPEGFTPRMTNKIEARLVAAEHQQESMGHNLVLELDEIWEFRKSWDNVLKEFRDSGQKAAGYNIRSVYGSAGGSSSMAGEEGSGVLFEIMKKIEGYGDTELTEMVGELRAENKNYSIWATVVEAVEAAEGKGGLGVSIFDAVSGSLGMVGASLLGVGAMPAIVVGGVGSALLKKSVGTYKGQHFYSVLKGKGAYGIFNTERWRKALLEKDDAIERFAENWARKTPAPIVALSHREKLSPSMTTGKWDDGGSLEENYHNRVSEIQDAHSSILANTVAGGITEDISDSHPGLHTSTINSITRAINSISRRIPKQPDMVQGAYNTGRMNVSRRDMEKFARAYHAINNPFSILEDLESGDITRDAVNAVKEVYPNLYGEYVSRLLSSIIGMEDELDYKSRVKLSVLFGAPFDITMSPNYINSLQGILAAQAGGEEEPETKISGVAKMSTDTRARSEAQRVLGR
jgi:hypothetical protein